MLHLSAHAFAAEGAQVFATDINNKQLIELQDVAGITPFNLDVTDGIAIDAFLAKIGAPNRFVYCASKAAVIGITKAVAADYVEIAALAVYLASDESGLTTGQTHVIDGGWVI